MKKYVKRLKIYDKIEFDTEEILTGMRRLKGERRKPTSIALEEEVLEELRNIADKKPLTTPPKKTETQKPEKLIVHGISLTDSIRDWWFKNLLLDDIMDDKER